MIIHKVNKFFFFEMFAWVIGAQFRPWLSRISYGKKMLSSSYDESKKFYKVLLIAESAFVQSEYFMFVFNLLSGVFFFFLKRPSYRAAEDCSKASADLKDSNFKLIFNVSI